jgi:hypothetical protein
MVNPLLVSRNVQSLRSREAASSSVSVNFGERRNTAAATAKYLIDTLRGHDRKVALA